MSTRVVWSHSYETIHVADRNNVDNGEEEEEFACQYKHEYEYGFKYGYEYEYEYGTPK